MASLVRREGCCELRTSRSLRKATPDTWAASHLQTAALKHVRLLSPVLRLQDLPRYGCSSLSLPGTHLTLLSCLIQSFHLRDENLVKEQDLSPYGSFLSLATVPKGNPPATGFPKEVKHFWVTGSRQDHSPGQDRVSIHLLQDMHFSSEPWELIDASYGVG